MEIHITEFDVALGADDTASFAAQGDVYAKVAQICWQTSGKQTWALPFDADCHKKPAYQSMLKALHSQ